MPEFPNPLMIIREESVVLYSQINGTISDTVHQSFLSLKQSLWSKINISSVHNCY